MRYIDLMTTNPTAPTQTFTITFEVDPECAPWTPETLAAFLTSQAFDGVKVEVAR